MGKIKPYMFECGDVISTTKSTWTILGRKIISEEENRYNGRKTYLCQCHECGASLWKPENELHQGVKGVPGQGNCGVCSNRVVLTGKNDVATTHPHVVKLFKDPEDALHINAASRDKRCFKCPDCGYEYETSVEYVTTKGRLCCPNCSDNISYPNKFAMSVLKQLNVDKLESEYRPKWSGNYRYDFSFWLNGIHYLLEMDGGFHYQSRFKKKVEKTQKADRKKDRLAKENNCVLIRIECKVSDLEYIKKRVYESKLAELYDLDVVDWIQVEKDCCTSILVSIAKYYNSHDNCSLDDIAKEFSISCQTARNYLKRSQKIGLTDYKTLLDEMNENFEVAVNIRKEHPEYTYLEISRYMDVCSDTVKNYLIKAEKLKMIDFANASDYKRHMTKEFIKEHWDLSNYEIGRKIHSSREYIEKCRNELMLCG